MMLCFILLLFLGSSANEKKVPAFAYVQVVPKGDTSQCKEVEWTADLCDSNPEEKGGPELCKTIMNSYKGYKCIESDGADMIGNSLSQIDKSVECLFLYNGVANDVTFDFTYLPRQMVVLLTTKHIEDFSRLLSVINKMPRSKLDGTQQGIINFAKQIQEVNQKHFHPKADFEMTNVKIVGNIKDKVSFLSLFAMSFEVVQSNLNVHTLSLCGSWLKSTSKFKVRTTYLISALSYNNLILNDLVDKSFIKAKHYQLFWIKNDTYINFGKDSLTVTCTMENEFTSSIPYELYNASAGIIIESGNVNLHASADSVVHDNFNITFSSNYIPLGPLGEINYDPFQEKMLSVDEKRAKAEKTQVKITVTGDYWQNHKPKITVNSPPELFEVDTSEVAKVTNLTESSLYSFGDIIEEEDYNVDEGDDGSSGDDGNKKDETTDKPKDSKNKLSTGAIVGIVVGCVAFVAIVVVVVIIVLRRKQKVGALSN